MSARCSGLRVPFGASSASRFACAHPPHGVRALVRDVLRGDSVGARANLDLRQGDLVNRAVAGQLRRLVAALRAREDHGPDPPPQQRRVVVQAQHHAVHARERLRCLELQGQVLGVVPVGDALEHHVVVPALDAGKAQLHAHGVGRVRGHDLELVALYSVGEQLLDVDAELPRRVLADVARVGGRRADGVEKARILHDCLCHRFLLSLHAKSALIAQGALWLLASSPSPASRSRALVFCIKATQLFSRWPRCFSVSHRS